MIQQFFFHVFVRVVITFFCGAVLYAAEYSALLPEGRLSIFKNLTTYGNVVYMHQVLEVPTGSDRSINLHVRFNSGSGHCSPYLGYGWKLPFLESSFTQINDLLYLANMPDGSQRLFVRDKKNPNILWGRNGWHGNINNKEIIIKSETKEVLIYRNGQLIRMKNDHDNLFFHYDENKVKRVTNNGYEIISVQTSDKKTILSSKNGLKVILQRGERPVSINGKLFTGVSSLGKIIFSPEIVILFKYSYDDNNDNIILSTKDQEFSWDAQSGLATQIGNWKYQIKPANSRNNNAEITRVNENGHKEYWHRDDSSGKEITEFYGVRREVTTFISGKLKGKKRKIEEIRDGRKINFFEFTYDEKGREIRIRSKTGNTIKVYSRNGKLAAVIHNNKIIRQYTSDAKQLAAPYIQSKERNY